MMDVLKQMQEALDRAQPGWEVEWATGDELRDFARDIRSGDNSTRQDIRDSVRRTADARLKRSVSQRVFHRVVNAALEAGVVGMPLPPTHVHVEGEDDGV